MADFKRYAIYYMPPNDALACWAAKWLGWDAQTGRACPHPDLAGLPRPVEDFTKAPRRYGFHATIKPPFRLKDGQTKEALLGAARALCASQVPVEMQGLHLHRLGNFLALTPVGEVGPLVDLAASMVRGLDLFRAAPSEEELARRRKSGLSLQQDRLLQQWGYPYVMEEFRFHMTLTGRLSGDEVEKIGAALDPILAPLLPSPFRIEELCLAGEDEGGCFHLLERLPLGTSHRR